MHYIIFKVSTAAVNKNPGVHLDFFIFKFILLKEPDLRRRIPASVSYPMITYKCFDRNCKSAMRRGAGYNMFKLLFENGVFVNPVISPAVPAGLQLLRTSYMSTHTDSQIEQVIEIFKKVGKELEVI